MLCGLVYVFIDRELDETKLQQHENGEVTFYGRPCTLCFGLRKEQKSEYRMVVL